MNLMDKNSKRLSLYICAETFDQLQRVALQEGRKTGSLARHILDRWVKSKEHHEKK
jgi:hypothetical protein